VEHFGLLALRALILAVISISLSACRSEDPNPELRDPIYKALTDELGAAEKGLEAAKVTKIQKYKELGQAEDRSIEKKNLEKEYWQAVKQVDSLNTAVNYLKIRSKRRRVETRRSYREAFKANKEDSWPDPSEYSGYLTNRRLREASLNWSRRVPKLRDRMPSSDETSKAQEKPKEGGEGAE